MSLLSSFSSDFNRDMEIFSTNEEIDSLWQRKLKYQKTWTALGILLPKAEKYDQFSTDKQWGKNGIVYDTFSFTFRCEFGVIIKKKYRLKDQYWTCYEVKRAFPSPWFGGDDHLVCYLEECDGIPIN